MPELRISEEAVHTCHSEVGRLHTQNYLVQVNSATAPLFTQPISKRVPPTGLAAHRPLGGLIRELQLGCTRT